MKKRNRNFFSLKEELIKRSKEAMLSAVQIYNNPIVMFKTESFIVLSIISWTYLMHAYYKSKKIEYREKNSTESKKRKYVRVGRSAFKYISLSKCINRPECPIDDEGILMNLEFLIGLRNQIEHQSIGRIDESVTGHVFACCVNYNNCIKKFFENEQGIEQFLSFSLQFSSLSLDQGTKNSSENRSSSKIINYVEDFEKNMSLVSKNSSSYSLKINVSLKNANNPKKADAVLLIDKKQNPSIDEKKDVNRDDNKNTVVIKIKETEKQKYRAGEIVKKMQQEGHLKFNMSQHTNLWKKENAREPSKEYGVFVVGAGYGYDKGLVYVKEYLNQNKVGPKCE